jgi:glycosyltransferase involved in cell wall biosynthesis
MTANTTSSADHKIKIGILEIRDHVTIINTFSRICKTGNTNVTIFTTKKLYSRLETYLKEKKNYDFIIKNDKESMNSFLKRVELICDDKIDLLFVNTIYDLVLDLFGYINFNPSSKMIITIHHANAWLKPKFVFNIKHMIRTIDTNICSVLIKKFILPKYDAINVIYPPIKDYILKNTDYDKEIFTLPTSIYDERKEVKLDRIDGKFRVVLPGFIQEWRKDYRMTLSVFENLFKSYNENLVLYIAGMPIDAYGMSIYKAFKKMKANGCNVEIFDHFVPDGKFDEILSNCDIVLAPIQINTKADNEIKEYYGITIGSGSIFDAIQYGKPIIAPDEFNMIQELKSSTVTYNNPIDLEQKIINLISNPDELRQLKKEGIANSMKFSVDKLQKYFEENILRWLKEN